MGVAALVRKLDDAKGVFSKLDSESDYWAQSEGDVLEAVRTADEYFCKMWSNQKIKDLIVDLRKSGVRLLHFAQSLQECIYFFRTDSINVAKAIPPNQKCPERRHMCHSKVHTLSLKLLRPRGARLGVVGPLVRRAPLLSTRARHVTLVL